MLRSEHDYWEKWERKPSHAESAISTHSLTWQIIELLVLYLIMSP